MPAIDRTLHLEVAADPGAPAAIHAGIRRWLVNSGVYGGVLDDLLVASDEINFETVLVPGVSHIEVTGEVVDGIVHLLFASDRRRQELRVVPFATGVEVVDDIGDELSIVRQVTDSLAIRTLPDATVVEITKVVA